MTVRGWSVLALVAALDGAAPAPLPSQAPALSTNERLQQELKNCRMDLESVDATFAYVFAQLPNRVRVVPTENYYYFRFACAGNEVWGNLRLDAVDRDEGLLDFGYFSAWNRPERPEDLHTKSRYRQLSEADGVHVRRRGPLLYDVTYRGKMVTFELHDLPQTPPAGMSLLESEVFVERTADESGFQFALLFDRTARAFRFVLDETAPLPDTLFPLEPGVVVGQLSGFAFYEDPERRRKILFGIDADNMRRNNYYDGPFDQLADNFVPPDLRAWMEEAYPYARGRIDFRGVFCDADGRRGSSRLALTPFVTYNSLGELRGFLAASRGRCRDTACMVSVLTRDYKQDVPAAPPPPETGPEVRDASPTPLPSDPLRLSPRSP